MTVCHSGLTVAATVTTALLLCVTEGRETGRASVEASLYGGLEDAHHCHAKLICLLAGLREEELKVNKDIFIFNHIVSLRKKEFLKGQH